MLANEKRQLHKSFGLKDAPIEAELHHKENLPIVVRDALQKSNVSSVSDLEAIAVTVGPGQLRSLNQGI